MTVVCPNCGDELPRLVSIARPAGEQEAICNRCWNWFSITKDGNAIKKPATQVAPARPIAARPAAPTPTAPQTAVETRLSQRPFAASPAQVAPAQPVQSPRPTQPASTVPQLSPQFKPQAAEKTNEEEGKA